MKAKVAVTIEFDYEADSDHYDNPETFEEFAERIRDYDQHSTLVEMLNDGVFFDVRRTITPLMHTPDTPCITVDG